MFPNKDDNVLCHALEVHRTVDKAALSLSANTNEQLFSISDDDGDDEILIHAVSSLPEEATLDSILKDLEKGLSKEKEKLKVEEEDLFNDAMSYYKDPSFDERKPLRVIYKGQPAVDTGGVAKHILEEGERTAEWYRNNYVLVNPEKYQSLVINPRNLNISAGGLDIKIKGKVIENVNKIKLLGVNVDENMNFAVHISEMCKKASRKVGVLMRLRNLIPVAAKVTIFKTSILSHLTYCQLVWHFCKSLDSRKVEHIQERALRAVYGNRTESYENLLERAKLPTLLNRWLQDIAALMYKVKNDLLPSSVTDIFSIKGSNYSLRNSDFNIPRVNTEKYGKHSLRYFGPFLWSKLPVNLRTAPSLNSFKNLIRTMDIHRLVSNNCNCCDLCRE